MISHSGRNWRNSRDRVIEIDVKVGENMLHVGEQMHDFAKLFEIILIFLRR